MATSFEESPMMRQHEEAKRQHPGMVLLFRVGDFYEMFGDDAKTAAKTLGLTITSRGKTPMSGFPHHQLETYLHKMLNAGHRLAICEPVDSDDGKNVKRETRTVAKA